MKKLFVALLSFGLLLSVGCASSKSAKSTKSFSSQKIIEVPDFTQSELYDKANVAITEMFRNAGSTLSYANKENGVMQGIYTLSIVRSGPYFHKMNVLATIEVKDGKTRVTFSELTGVYSADALSAKYTQKDKAITLDSQTTLEEKFAASLDLDAELANFVDTYVAKLGTQEW